MFNTCNIKRLSTLPVMSTIEPPEPPDGLDPPPDETPRVSEIAGAGGGEEEDHEEKGGGSQPSPPPPLLPPHLQGLNDEQLFAWLRKQVQESDAQLCLSLQMQATAQRRAHAVLTAPLWLACLERLRRRLRAACEEICALSLELVPSPDLEVQRALKWERHAGDSGSATPTTDFKQLPPLPEKKLAHLRARIKKAAEEYEQGMQVFENGWDGVVELGNSWADVPRGWQSARPNNLTVGADGTSESQSQASQLEKRMERLIAPEHSWFEDLPKGEAQSITSHLEAILSDLDKTAKSIVRLDAEGLNALCTRPKPYRRDSSATVSPEEYRTVLELLLHMITIAHGAEGLLGFAVRIFVEAAPLTTPGKPTKVELEQFLLAFMDELQASRATVQLESRGNVDGLPQRRTQANEEPANAAFALLEPSLDLELELLAFLKAGRQRLAQKKIEKLKSDPRQSIASTDSDELLSPTARSLSGTLVNSMTSTASQLYNDLAHGWSTLHDAAASQFLQLGAPDKASNITEDAEEEAHTVRKPTKPALYERKSDPSKAHTKPVAFSSFLTPAAPTRAKVSGAWSDDSRGSHDAASIEEDSEGPAVAAGAMACESPTISKVWRRRLTFVSLPISACRCTEPLE